MRTTHIWTVAALAAALATVLLLPAQAQQDNPGSRPALAPPPPGGPPGDRDEWREQRREEMRRKIETIRIARLTEELNLDPETAVRLVPLLSKFDELERAHREKRRALYMEARNLVDEDSDNDRALVDKMDAFWELEETHLRERRELFEETDDILTTRQQAQLMLFIPRFRTEIRELIHEFRENRQGPGGRWDARDDRPARRRWNPGMDDEPPE